MQVRADVLLPSILMRGESDHHDEGGKPQGVAAGGGFAKGGEAEMARRRMQVGDPHQGQQRAQGVEHEVLQRRLEIAEACPVGQEPQYVLEKETSQ